MRDFLVTYIEGANLIFVWLVYYETDHEEKVKSVAACGASADFTFYKRSVIFFIAKKEFVLTNEKFCIIQNRKR